MGIATRHISPQIALSAVLFIGLAAIAYHALNDQLLKAFLVVLIPIAIIYIILSIKRPLIALITYGTLCYFWAYSQLASAKLLICRKNTLLGE